MRLALSYSCIGLAAICARIAEDHDEPLATVEADTRRFLGELKANAIIVEAEKEAGA